jgi:hypothetical protein
LNTGLEQSLFDIMETTGWQILPAEHLFDSSPCPLCLCGELNKPPVVVDLPEISDGPETLLSAGSPSGHHR